MKFIRAFLAALVLVFVSNAAAQAPSPQLVIKDWCPMPLQLEFSPNGGELARVCFGYAIAFFDTTNYHIAHTFLSELEHTPELEDFAVSPDGTMIATTLGSGTQVWNAADPGKPWPAQEAPSISVKEKSAWVMAELYTWDTRRILEAATDDRRRVSSIKFSPNGKLLLTVHTNQAKVWNTTSWKIEKEIRDPNQGLDNAFFSPDGNLLLACFANGHFKVWNVSSWTVEREFGVSNGGPYMVTFAPDGQTVMIGQDGVIHQWSLARKTEIRTLRTSEGTGSQGMLGGVAFSPDGRTLVATSLLAARPVIVWNTRDWSAQTETGYNSAAFSKDGKSLALGGRNLIKLVDPASLRQFREISLAELTRGEVQRDQDNENRGNEKISCMVSNLAFSPAGDSLAAACNYPEGTIRIIKMTP